MRRLAVLGVAVLASIPGAAPDMTAPDIHDRPIFDPISPYPDSPIDGTNYRTLGVKSADTADVTPNLKNYIIVEGFSVAVNVPEIRSELGPMDVAVAYNLLDDEGHDDSENGIYTDADSIVIGGGDLGGMYDGASSGSQRDTIQIINSVAHSEYSISQNEPQTVSTALESKGFAAFRDDISYASTAGSQIGIEFFHFGKDGSELPVRQIVGAVSAVPNGHCKDLPSQRKLLSEVVLTKKQVQKICEVIKLRDEFLPPDTMIALDSAETNEASKDMFIPDIRRVTLTYPYLGDDTVSDERLAFVLLHEFTHAAFSRLADNDPLKLRAAAIYRRFIVNDKGRTIYDDRAPELTIVKEGTYFKKFRAAGHPGDNGDELNSSAAATAVFFAGTDPDGPFWKRYDAASPRRRNIVRAAIRNAVAVDSQFDPDFTGTITGWPTINRMLSEG